MNAIAPIDPVAVAKAIIADPRKKFTMSVLQIMSICNALVDSAENPQAAIPTELAEATRTFIDRHSRLLDDGIFAQNGAVLIASNEAFRAFKTLFEVEFPHDASV